MTEFQEKARRQWLTPCIPNYSRGRDQKNCNLKPALDKQFARPYLKEIHHKKGLVEWPKQ
jgi:hypothetical protein